MLRYDPGARLYSDCMRMIDVDPQDVLRERQSLIEVMRSVEMRAYAVEDSAWAGGLLDFPVPSAGPSFVWTGYWRTTVLRQAGSTPLLTIATASNKDRDALRDRLRLSPHVADRRLPVTVTLETSGGLQTLPLQSGMAGAAFVEFEDDDTAVAVVVRDAETVTGDIRVRPWTDREALIFGWMSLFKSFPTD